MTRLEPLKDKTKLAKCRSIKNLVFSQGQSTGISEEARTNLKKKINGFTFHHLFLDFFLLKWPYWDLHI